MKSAIVLIATLALMGCSTLDPGVSVDVGNYGVKVGTDHVSVTASTTGTNLDTTEFKAGVTVCFKEDGVVSGFLDNLGSIGGIFQNIIVCKS